MSSAKRRLVVVPPPMLTVPSWSSRVSVMILSSTLKRVGGSTHPCRTLNYSSEPASYAAVEEDCIGGLVIEDFDDLVEVGTDVLLLHGCPQSCKSNPVEDLLEVYEDMVHEDMVYEDMVYEDILVLRCTFYRLSSVCCLLVCSFSV